MTDAIDDQRARQALRAPLGAARLHPAHPGGPGRRPGRPERRGQDHLAALAVGLLAPTAGTIEVLGAARRRPASLQRVGFVAQDTPLYAGLSVADHLRMGAWLNPAWDAQLAERRHRAARPRPAPDRPARSRAASAPSSRSRSPSRSGRNCCSSTSRWPASTRSPGASSCAA